MAWGAMMSAAVDDELSRDEARHVLRRTARMLRPYRWAAVKSVLQMVAYTLCLLSGPVIVGIVIDDALPPKHHHLHVVVVGGIVYLVLALLMGIFERAQIMSVNRVGESFLRDLRVKVFGHLVSLSMSFFDREPTGRLVSRMTQDIDALEMLVQQGLLIFVSSGLIFTAVMVIMLVDVAIALSPLPYHAALGRPLEHPFPPTVQHGLPDGARADRSDAVVASGVHRPVSR